MPIYIYIYQISKQNELDRNSKQLENGITIIDSTITALKNSVTTTESDTRFQVFKYESLEKVSDPIVFNQMRQTFNSLIVPHSLVADAGILFSGKVILTRQRTFYSDDLYRFYNQFFQCGDLSYNEWILHISQNNELFLPESTFQTKDFGTYSALTYVMRWSASSSHQASVFYATLPISGLLPLLAEQNIINRGYVRIIDQSQTVLYSYHYSDSNKYVKIHGHSDIGRLNFEIGIPSDLLRVQLLPVQNLMLTFTFAIILIALVLVIFFSYYSSAPMTKLLQVASQSKFFRFAANANNSVYKPRIFWNMQQEYHDLASSISRADLEIESYQQTIEHQKEMLQTQIFEKALQKGLYGSEEFARFQSLFPDFPAFFCLTVLYYDLQQPSETDINVIPDGTDKSDRSVVFQVQLLSYIRGLFPGMHICSLNANMIILLLTVTGDNKQEISIWQDQLKSLRRELMQKFNYPVTFAMSDVFNRPQDLYMAYRQVQLFDTFSQQNLINWVKPPIDPVTAKVILPLNFSNMQTIYEALTTGNFAVAQTVLNECTSVLFALEDHTFMSQHLYAAMRQIIVQLKLENPDRLYNIVVPYYESNRRYIILMEEIPKCFQNICEIVNSTQNNAVDQVAQHVLEFIHENLFNPELYVNMAVEHFDISAPTLQKLVKKVTGQTFSTYIEDQRLEKAYRLLTCSGIPITEVSTQCGFYSSNSFYKAFKRKYGISPSAVSKK